MRSRICWSPIVGLAIVCLSVSFPGLSVAQPARPQDTSARQGSGLDDRPVPHVVGRLHAALPHDDPGRFERRWGKGPKGGLAGVTAGIIGHTERVPDPQERDDGLQRMGADWVGNPTLTPTGNTGLNADITYQRQRVATSFSVYRDWLSGFITIGPQTKVNRVSGVMNRTAPSTTPSTRA
jgi:hypothetical protein